MYGINFGVGEIMDKNLRAIAQDTGGRTFEAARGEDLSGVYTAIHRQVAGEYLIRYRATTTPAEKKYVQVSVTNQGSDSAASRFYFSSVVFGLPLSNLSPVLIIPFVLAIALLWLLTFVKLERRPGPANLEVLQTRVGHPNDAGASLVVEQDRDRRKPKRGPDHSGRSAGEAGARHNPL